MIQIIRQAVPFDKRLLELVCPRDADGTDAVHVLSEDLTAVRYVLTDPASRFAACSFPVAMQQKPCKHQVTWLLSLAPAGRTADAERLILSRLGTLLGFAGGCSMDCILTLSVALKNLLPVALELQVSEPSPVAAAGAVEADHIEMFDVAPGSNDTGVPALPAPRLLGPLALQNHWQELHALLEEECLGALDKAAASMQHSLALQQKALLVRARDASVSAASTAHELRENFASAADITYKRHKCGLELPPRNAKSPTTKQPCQAPLQKDFAKVRRDDSQHVSKAFRGGRSAKQAAEHVQQCMSTALHNTCAWQQQQQPLHPLSLQQAPLLQQPQQRQRQQLEPEIWGLPQLLSPTQQQEQMANTASLVMPQQPLHLLQEYLMLQDRRRLEAEAAAGGVVPRSMLALGQLPH
jgi:hypothetical protein